MQNVEDIYHQRAREYEEQGAGGEEAAADVVRTAEAALAPAAKGVADAVAALDTLRARHPELNALSREVAGQHQDVAAKLLDEGIFGCPLWDDLGQRYSALRQKETVIGACIQRLVEVHYQQAQRGIHVAQIQDARARYEYCAAQAVWAIVHRHRLMAPVLAFEQAVILDGGITAEAIKSANARFQELRQLEKALVEFDQAQASRNLKF